MKKPLTPEAAQARLEALCARSEQSVHDLRLKLRTWGIAGTDAETIINALQRARYVDDRRFARAFALDKHRFNRWGPAKIRAALIAHRIDARYIAEAMAELDPDESLENLVALLRPRVAGEPDYAARQKLYRLAAARGYSAGDISQALKKLRDEQ